jgi:hypothetical protein
MILSARRFPEREAVDFGQRRRLAPGRKLTNDPLGDRPIPPFVLAEKVLSFHPRMDTSYITLVHIHRLLSAKVFGGAFLPWLPLD